MRQIDEYYIRFNKKPNFIISTIFDVLDSLTSAIIAVFLIFAVIFRAVGVSGDSMNPTLNDRDWVAITAMPGEFKKGDIVVVVQPWERDIPIIKRIIATEGDTIDIDFEKGVVSVNGNALYEPYTLEPTYVFYEVEFPVTVEKGKVFVMGDNRNNSLDSRSSRVGQIDERYILGKAFYRLSPDAKKLSS